MIIKDRTKFTRSEILRRLHESISQGKPILGAGASNGLVAKSAEVGGADLIVAYSTGKSRHMGLPTSRNLGHSNKMTLEMYAELDNVVDDTPIIGGAEAADHTYRRLGRLVGDFRGEGYDGLINFPTIGSWAERARQRDRVGGGYLSEVEMTRYAREHDYFTMVYVYNTEHARLMAEAGADMLIAHVGWTMGGRLGNVADTAPAMEEACERVQTMIDAAKAENPDIIPVAHGGPFSEPADTEPLYRLTSAVGFVGASSIERIPIERAVAEVCRDYKAVSLAR